MYFNDSTKAILQAQGDAFQYVERRKLQDADTRSEPLCKIHSLEAYPDELHKKVTLLKHFRNYLLEQQKKSDEDGLTPSWHFGYLICLPQKVGTHKTCNTFPPQRPDCSDCLLRSDGSSFDSRRALCHVCRQEAQPLHILPHRRAGRDQR